MAELTAAEVIEVVEGLRNIKEGQDLRRDIRRRLEQHAMTDVPWVPDVLTSAGKTVVMNSPRVAELARQINAVMASYVTIVTVSPGTPELQNKADEVEKKFALKRAELFTPQVVQRARWRQMVVAYDFYKLWCGDPGETEAWGVIQPDPLSCYFLLGDESLKTMRPSIIGREYWQSVRSVTGFDDQREERRPTWDGKNWGWERISDESSADAGRIGVLASSVPSVLRSQFEQVLFYEYDDGETCYIVGMNSDKKSGEMLWKQKNLTGGSSYVAVPGYMTGSTELREKILPHLWGPMNVQYQIDVINTLRATRSTNIKPQVLMERDPELMKAASQMGILRPVPDGYESLGAETIIELDGKPHFWVLPEDKDLAALEDSKQKELAEYISTELSLTKAEIIKDAPVRNVQLALGIRAQQQGLMLTFEAIGEREILKMWAHSVECDGGYPDERNMFTSKDVSYNGGIIKAGEAVSFKKGDFNFDYHLDVSTASLSEQERQFLVQAAAERKVLRITTWPEVIDSAGYQNRKEQMLALIEEEGYEGAARYYQPWLEPVFRKRMAERRGILIPGPQEIQEAQGGPQMGPVPNAFPVPQTQQVEGASSSGAPV